MSKMRLLCVIVAMVLAVVAKSTPMLADDGFEPITLAEVRSDVAKLFAQLQTFDNECVVILPALLAEIDGKILDLRNLIATRKASLVSVLDRFEAISAEFGIFTGQLTLCRILLGITNPTPDVATAMSGSMLLEFYHLLEGVSFLCEFNQLDLRKCQKILSILGANFGITFVGTAATGIFSSIINTFLTVETRCGTTAITIPKGPLTPEDWRRVNLFLGKGHNFFNCINKIFRNVAKLKKWLYKGLREIYTLLGASNFGGQEIVAPPDSRSIRIYTLSGQLVDRERGGLSTTRLANGVYLIVSESLNADGTKNREMRTLVITH
jgi:hypothetical protein